MEQAAKQLEPLAQKLGVTVEHIWNALLKQAMVDGLTSLGTFLAAVAVAVAAVFTYRVWISRPAKKPDTTGFVDRSQELFETLYARIVLVFVLLGCLIIAWNQIYWILTDFFNPEFYAYRQLPFVR
jgi:hypothetical protein